MADNTYTPDSQALTVVQTTLDCIAISWDGWADKTVDPASVLYQVGITEDENPADPWHIVKEAAKLDRWTFRDLKPGTSYCIFVKAFVGTDLVCEYPVHRGCLTVSTLIPDSVAPKVKSKAIDVTAVTYDSISIAWEPATDNITAQDKIRYRVWLRQSGASNDAWQKKNVEETGISSFTFKGLKLGTKYDFYVEAIDEVGNVLRYPDSRSYMAVSTLADTAAPTVKSRALNVTGTTRNSISIKWEPATDNLTQQSKIRYEVWCKMSDVPSDPWKKVEDKTGLTSYTFNNLKEATTYSFHVDAFDEAGNVLKYPLDNGCMTASTASSDKAAPTVKNRAITVTGTTRNSISINWEPATDNVTQQSKIRYQVYCTMSDVSSDPWKKVEERTGISSYTFNNLKENTKYSFYVDAFDEAGNVLQYPLDNGCMTARTATSTTTSSDKVAPTVKNRAITVTGTTSNSISIQWEPATDNVTQQSKIRYEVYCKMSDVPSDPWKKVAERTGISSYTFNNLKASTTYGFYVDAFDEAGNVLHYPLDNGCMTGTTKAGGINSLPVTIEQKATVLVGSQASISMEIKYNYVRYNANGVVAEMKSGTWEQKWSKRGTTNTAITLPDNWYFDKNPVQITIRSRKAATLKWEKCSEGTVDISKGTLNLTLTGNYLLKNVKYTVNP